MREVRRLRYMAIRRPRSRAYQIRADWELLRSRAAASPRAPKANFSVTSVGGSGSARTGALYDTTAEARAAGREVGWGENGITVRCCAPTACEGFRGRTGGILGACSPYR